MPFLPLRNSESDTSLKPKIRKFLVDGEYIPAHDVSYFIIKGVGGGGSGGGKGLTDDAGGGGASGSYFEKIVKNPYGKYLIKIGLGGLEQTNATSEGHKGGDTTFIGKDV